MRIAIIAHDVVKKGSGHGKANYEFIKHLINKTDNEIHLYANKVEQDIINYVHFHKIKVIPKPLIIKIPLFAIIVTIKLLNKRYDRIIADGETYLAKADFIHSQFCHKRYLKYVKGLYNKIYENLSCIFEYFQYKRPCKIICASYKLKQEIIEEYGISENKIFVIHNCVDLSEYKIKKHTPKKEIKVLFVGDLSYRKGLDYVISATKHLDKNIQLIIAGKLRRKYKKLAKNIDNIKFLGFVPNIEEVLQTADAFILPSIYDPFPFAVIEAMANGIPVIISKNSGVSEIITDMENGIIINNPQDIDEIKEKISLLCDYKLREKISKNAIRTIKEKLDLNKVLTQKEKIIFG